MMKKNATGADRSPSMVRADLVHKVAVVGVHERGCYEYAEEYVQELRHRGIKTVDFYVAFNTRRAQSLYISKRRNFLFNPRSFGWNGKIKDAEINKGISRDYDIVIDLTMGRSFAADVLIHKMTAAWKAGKEDKTRRYLLDFMIRCDGKDVRYLVHHLDRYLMNFNKSNAA